MDKTDEVMQLFKKGYSCSQAILIAYGPDLGLDREAAMKVAGGFGGGMGNTGLTCGAVTGALMALGLKYTKVEAKGSHSEADDKAQEYLRRFEDSHKSTICENLIGCDLSSPGGREEANKKNVHQTICVNLIRDAADLLEEMLGNGVLESADNYPGDPFP